MGTRSTIKFYGTFDNEKKQQPIVAIYQQFDGYLDGVGLDLATWLADKTIINGIYNETAEQGYANGMECLAAQFIKDFKTGIGGFYLTSLTDVQEYNYEVSLSNTNEIMISVEDFEGTVKEFISYVANLEED